MACNRILVNLHKTTVCLRRSNKSYATVAALEELPNDIPLSKKLSVVENDLRSATPYDELPMQKGNQVLRTFINAWQSQGRFHIFQMEQFEKYGPIYRHIIMNKYDFVYTCDVETIERLLRLEGKYPQRLMLQPWIEWRNKMGLARGILISEGEKWKRMRTQLDKQMLRPTRVSEYTDNFNGVVSDFVERIKQVRHNDNSIERIDNELFHWSLETIGTVLYEIRLGSFSGSRSPEITQFVNAVHDLFISTEKVTFMPDFMKKTFGKKWQIMHANAWSVIFSTTKKLVDNKLEEIQRKLRNDEEVGGFLSTLLKSEKLSLEEVYANISELMAASVDTTSNTMQWCLYELAKNPKYQENILQEQQKVLGDRTIPTYNDLQKMPFLKAVIKETLRLYPIAGLLTRTLTEDFNMCGYRVPSGTNVILSTYATGRDPNHYQNPECFMPGRWLRAGDDTKRNVHTFSWLPFGHGPRVCVGKRVAELEMHLLLAGLIQHFHLEVTDDIPVKIVSKSLLLPERAVPVKFVDR